MPPIKVNHIAVVVQEIEPALKFWRDALGLELQHSERNEEEAVEIAFLPVGESEIELLAPITEDSGVAKYMEKKGAGLHHVCIDVDDINAVIDRLKEHKIAMINDTPRTRPDGTLYAFVHPKSTGGVLLELYQSSA